MTPLDLLAMIVILGLIGSGMIFLIFGVLLLIKFLAWLGREITKARPWGRHTGAHPDGTQDDEDPRISR